MNKTLLNFLESVLAKAQSKFEVILTMFEWSFLPTFLIVLDSFLYEKSMGLEYPLRNHLKAEKEIQVSVYRTLHLMLWQSYLKYIWNLSLSQLAFNFSTAHTLQTHLWFH